MSRNLFLVMGLLAFAGILFFLMGASYFDQPTVLTTSTLALVFVTLFYTLATFSMAEEMRHAREEEYRPEVIIDFDADPKHTDLICLVVQNIGRRPARNVRFIFDRDPVNWRGVNIAKTGAFDNGINFLSPHRTLQWRYDSFSTLVQNPEKPKRFAVTIEYQDIKKQGEKARSYQESFVLDINQFWEQYVCSESIDKNIEDISRMTEKIVSELGKFREHFHDANYQAIRKGNDAYYKALDEGTEESKP